MHLLAAQPGGFIDTAGIVDLQQTPADIVILASQDTSLALLAEVAEECPAIAPSLRLANLAHLAKPAAYDLYEHSVLQHARLIIVSLLGGASYWPYGVERLRDLAQHRHIPLLLLPGDDQPDAELVAASTAAPADCHRVWRFLREGGRANTRNLLRFLQARYFAAQLDWQEPRALPPCQLYFAGADLTLAEWQQRQQADRPVALLLFYRSHLQSGNTAALDQFIDILATRFNVLAVATLSLKHPSCRATLNRLIRQTDCQVIFNTTSFSQHVQTAHTAPQSDSAPQSERPFEQPVPVIQTILAANPQSDWQASSAGLRARDLAMNVVLPEFDGRIIGRAISFKSVQRHDPHCQLDVIRYALHAERADFVAELGWRWAALARKPNAQKNIALILPNYPSRDARIGNGVGLDTPASTLNLLHALAQAGYQVADLPPNGAALMQRLQSNVTNDTAHNPLRPSAQGLPLARYRKWFAGLPESNQRAVLQQWGQPEQDAKLRHGQLMVAGQQFGRVFVGIQPARGFDLDLAASYHSPDLVPPHAYLAFYCWLRQVFQADAIVHVGKHGNLEWLPGKSVALSAECWPELALGPLPHLYPFIVNDPGEGAQAKRRAQAVILDHLTPPMARAETYGALLDIEKLLDEYYQALGLDARRQEYLRTKLLQQIQHTHLHQELQLDLNAAADQLLNQVDTYLCELKEAQIRHGLHRYGQLPAASKLSATLVALTRLPRGDAAAEQGLLHCLVQDLALKNADGSSFDPLDFAPAAAWHGKRPACLSDLSPSVWRSQADTRERLELLAEKLLDAQLNQAVPPADLPQTAQLLAFIQHHLRPAVNACATDEIKHFLQALDGGFVPAGPSGAPTRGRLDVLPTGRNFYSIDARSIPTPSAWELAQRAAQQLLDKHLQEHGELPKQIGISVWGTSTMRTGGDDIAQAFALMGVRPVWASASNRVVDIEIIPAFQLGRPRVDVTLRISGFFRDAFANVARLFDAAVQALIDYVEPGDSNVLRAHALAEQHRLVAAGVDAAQAKAQSRFRLFGSKPGSYGAGLQHLLDAGSWDTAADLAKAYVNWGGYSYTQADFGRAAFAAFENRLSQLDVVLQNQDNREHDLLDSDDYYQFQGGMANAVNVLSGHRPAIYHGDHANPARPVVRTLKQELNRVLRSRLLNPKWLAGMREHGYKGAFEMAASVDYLFGYAATTALVDDYQFANVTDALLLAPHNHAFLQQTNPQALKEIAERLLEAQQRGLWQAPGDYQQTLVDMIVDIENQLEQEMPGE